MPPTFPYGNPHFLNRVSVPTSSTNSPDTPSSTQQLAALHLVNPPSYTLFPSVFYLQHHPSIPPFFNVLLASQSTPFIMEMNLLKREIDALETGYQQQIKINDFFTQLTCAAILIYREAEKLHSASLHLRNELMRKKEEFKITFQGLKNLLMEI